MYELEKYVHHRVSLTDFGISYTVFFSLFHIKIDGKSKRHTLQFRTHTL